MGRPLFKSVFAEEMNAYLDYHTAAGQLERSFYHHLQSFDRFCSEQGISEPLFSRGNAVKWIQKKDSEASTTHYARVNGIKHFLMYLDRKGFDVFITRDVKFKPTDSI